METDSPTAASLSRRFAAGAIDVVPMLVLLILSSYFFGWLGILLIAWILCYVALTAFGQSLGKRLMHIRIIQINGDPAGWLRGVLRFPAFLLCCLGPFFWVNLTVVCVHTQHRGLHDFLTGTIVVDMQQPVVSSNLPPDPPDTIQPSP